MKLLVAANIVPFMRGGADYHIGGLVAALRQAGHQVEELRFPFKFSPNRAILDLMDCCESYDCNQFNGIEVDRLISLQFPAYGVSHARHVLWLMHQHRGAYELWDGEHASPEDRQLRDRIREFDTRAISAIAHRFANSRRVAGRLREFNGLEAKPLYHPPHGEERFYCARPHGYIYYPSRQESLKRQDLLIQAARYVTTPVKFILSGDGGQQRRYQSLIDSYGLGERVRLIGHVSEVEKLTWYARSLGVFFGPFDEDYGYVTLEAMLSSKPVITCTDSGGPLELVEDAHTGLVVEPTPKAVAAAADELFEDRSKAERLGAEGRRRYGLLGISWQNVVRQLLS